MGQRVMVVSHECFMMLFKLDGTMRVKVTGMPPDAKFLAVREEWFCGQRRIAFLVESEEFSTVPEGSERPTVEPLFHHIDCGSAEGCRLALEEAVKRERGSEHFFAAVEKAKSVAEKSAAPSKRIGPEFL